MLYDFLLLACNSECKEHSNYLSTNNMELRHNLNCHKNVKVSHIHLDIIPGPSPIKKAFI